MLFLCGYTCSNVRGVINQDFKINEHLKATNVDSNVWPSLANYNSNLPKETIKKICSYDIRKDKKIVREGYGGKILIFFLGGEGS